MNRSTPGLPVHHQLPESTQTHVHWIGDAIQPSHPLSSPSPPILNLSQHQDLFIGHLLTWGVHLSVSYLFAFHTVHGVLEARILKWLAIAFSSGPHSVRPLHHDPFVLGGPTQHGLVLYLIQISQEQKTYMCSFVLLLMNYVISCIYTFVCKIILI